MKKFIFTLFAALPMMTNAATVDSQYNMESLSNNHHHSDQHDDSLTATVDVPTGIFTSTDPNFITPFVSTPDGKVIKGTPVPSGDLPTTLTFPVVKHVHKGSYEYGLLVVGTDITVSAETLPVIVTSTETGIATSVNIFVPFFNPTTSNSQYTTIFTYIE